jgi:hypothetical protein
VVGGAAVAKTSLTALGTRADSGYYLKGSIDEVRVSNTNRPAAWVKASYYSGMQSLLLRGEVESIGGTLVRKKRVPPLSSRVLVGVRDVLKGLKEN